MASFTCCCMDVEITKHTDVELRKDAPLEPYEEAIDRTGSHRKDVRFDEQTTEPPKQESSLPLENPEEIPRGKSPMITETLVDDEEEEENLDDLDLDPATRARIEYERHHKKLSKLSFEQIAKESQLSFL